MHKEGRRKEGKERKGRTSFSYDSFFQQSTHTTNRKRSIPHFSVLAGGRQEI